MDSKIIVVTHKDFDDSVLPTGYQVVKVGTGKVDHNEWQTDATGVNIADENPYYCELTAQYWVWKNEPVVHDLIGLVHYRRYFFDYSGGFGSNYSDNILSVESARRLLDNKKVIMSFPTVKFKGYGTLYKNQPKGDQDYNWVIIENIIKRDYPELVNSFNNVLYGKFTTWGNMLITTQEVFNEYSEWIFDVLHKYDYVIKESGRERIPRVDGFLSEYLLLVWFHNRFKPRDIKYLEVRNTETDSFSDYGDGLVPMLVRTVRRNYPLLFAARYIRLGYLLLKRQVFSKRGSL